MATVLNVTEILKRSDGTEVKISGDSKFYAQNNYANLILLDIEDGGSLEACALINFTQQTRQSFTSHNFFMKPVGIVTRVVNDEVINAYQYAIQVPKLVLQNNTKGVIETDLTATVSFGANYKGYFPNLTNLNVSLPPTEQLQNDLSIAYVVELEQFLQVQYNPTNSVYEWVEVDYVDMFLTQKQYSLSPIYIQPGYSSPQGIAPISVSNTQVIMNILNDLEVLYNSLEEDFSSHITDLNNPHEVTAEQVDTYNKTAIDLKDADTLQEAKDYTYSKVEIDNKDANTLQEAKDYTDILGIIVEQNKQDIEDIEDGTTVVKKAEQDQLGNDIVNTYETKSDATNKLAFKADKTYVDSQDQALDNKIDTKESLENKAQDFTTINETLYPSVQATKTELDKKVDKTLTIIGLDLQDNILIGEFRTTLGNATQSVAGLLSAEDKTHLDGLVALLETSDGNNVVDTIGEILDIFQNYPEGADILTALNGKVDKVVDKQLSTNDLTNALKGYYDTAYSHSQIKDKSNPHNTSFANITDKPTTRDGFGITDVYTKPETYTQQEINALFDNLSAVKGLKSTLLTPTELSNGDTISTNLLTNNGAYIVFTATDTSTEEIDSDTVPVSTIKTGKKFVFFDNQEIVFTIGSTTSTFQTTENITLKINLLYLDAENVQAIGVDFDGSLTNYLLSQTNVQEAIEKIDSELKTTNDNLNNHTNNINNPHSVTKTQVGLGNVDNTSDLDKPISTAQQTALGNKVNVTRKIADIDLQDDITKQELKVALDVDDIETANMIKSITRSGSDLFTITYYDDTTSSLLTLAELKSFIGEATQSLSGLMSAQDKVDLDTLMALFDSDGDSVVNTIQEILDIFENYPEGADLVTELAGKVDKTSIVDNVTTNDATKVLSAKQGKELNDTVALKVNTSDIVNNLTSTDTNKPLSANQGKVLQDTKEATANKAIDFSVVNDTKYPTTKAVKDLVDTIVGDIGSILDSILGV